MRRRRATCYSRKQWLRSSVAAVCGGHVPRPWAWPGAAALGEQGIARRGRTEITARVLIWHQQHFILQGDICPSETFPRVQKNGLTLLVATDPELMKYLNNGAEQLKDWL